MTRERGGRRGWPVAAAVLLAAGVAVAVAVWRSATPPEGPVEVAWDRVRCDHCGMLVSERGFAAQLHEEDGRVEIFDDPGCLLAELAATGRDPASVHALWFHHYDEARWVSGDRVVFERVDTSPMGYGLAAHERGELGGDGLDLEAALRQVRARDRARASGDGPRP